MTRLRRQVRILGAPAAETNAARRGRRAGGRFREASGALACVLALAGCDVGRLLVRAASEAPALPVLELPTAPRTAEGQSVEEVLRSLRTLEGVERDPFLTHAEAHPAVAAVTDVPAGPEPRAVVARARPLGDLAAIENEADLIVFGTRDGRRTAVWRGIVLQEGGVFGDYVVTRVTDDGIDLRLRTGTATRSLRFKRRAAQVWK